VRSAGPMWASAPTDAVYLLRFMKIGFWFAEKAARQAAFFSFEIHIFLYKHV